MSFDPKKLPADVYETYKMGVMAWPLVIQNALNEGISSLDTLTDIMFHLHYPERKGRPLSADEAGLIKVWKGFRGMVASRHAAHIRKFRGGPSGSTSGVGAFSELQGISTSVKTVEYPQDADDRPYGGPDKAQYDLTNSR